MASNSSGFLISIIVYSLLLISSSNFSGFIHVKLFISFFELIFSELLKDFIL